MTDFQITRAAKFVSDCAQENDHIPRVLEPLCGDVLFIIDQSDHRDCWSWIDYAERTLVVQRDISACNRGSERAAGFGHAFNGFTQLPEVFRLVRVAEIQAIRDGQRPRAGTGEIARCFSNSNFAALTWIKRAIE